MSKIRVIRKKRAVRLLENLFVSTSVGNYTLRNGKSVEIPTNTDFTLVVSQQPLSLWKAEAYIPSGMTGDVYISTGFFGPKIII